MCDSTFLGRIPVQFQEFMDSMPVVLELGHLAQVRRLIMDRASIQWAAPKVRFKSAPLKGSFERGYRYRYGYLGVDIDRDMDIDSEVAVFINRWSCKYQGSGLL